MEVQITEFENAAYAVFVVLLTRTILSLDLNLYMPLSKVDENMKTAHKRDAVKIGSFFFRKHVIEGEHQTKTEIVTGSQTDSVLFFRIFVSC
jgi:glutamate--cysteine ligase catalytic subunit